MKIKYKKPKIFPSWTKFSGNEQVREYYSCQDSGIVFDADSRKLPHFNHIEMAGFETSSIISYKLDSDKKLTLYRFCVFPQIRVIPDETRGSLSYQFDSVNLCFASGLKTEKIEFNGLLTFYQTAEGVEIKHMVSPAYDKKALVERIELKNTEDKKKLFTVENKKPYKKISKVFLAEDKVQAVFTDAFLNGEYMHGKSQTVCLEPFEKKIILVCSGAEKLTAQEIENQLDLRFRFIEQMHNCMQIVTPDERINSMTEFCKIRAAESIFNTKSGLMHGPGGGNYYAALWTNDQCEYANPLFAYLGYPVAEAQSVNCYKLFSKLASENNAIPTSIVACGADIWNGAGDRGDSSMFLYGLCRYLLTTGDREKALEFLPAIETALQYVRSQITADGIVKSDSDELENRFESGKANLSTACITYDAFVSLHYLYSELGCTDKSESVLADAQRIKNSIENYFGAEVEGFATYRYCEEEKRLRSWICLPLVMGIDNRRAQTVDALLSDKLCKDNGMLTRSGEKTYWDRSLLYALRGLFYVGEADKAADLLGKYTSKRLLGFHPPYPIEAFPEGNSAQLSAESALYLRIFTEGILGYRPTGFYQFELKPNLPDAWDHFEVKNIKLCGQMFNISVLNGDAYTIKINDKTMNINKGGICPFHAE